MGEGQPIEFIIDTGSPITIIPPIINPNELQETTNCFEDVNKSPINFENEALVEVKTEKKQRCIANTHSRKQEYINPGGTDLAR